MSRFKNPQFIIGFTFNSVFIWYGFDGIKNNSKQIVTYAYSQEMISDFDKFFICIEEHCKVFFIHGLFCLYTFYGYPFHREPFEENKKRIPRTWLPPRFE